MNMPEAWERLSPGMRRAVVLGGVLGGVALIVVLAFGESSNTPAVRAEQARAHMTSTLLTDVDPRAIGIDGLAQRLARLERQLSETANHLAQQKTAEEGAVTRQFKALQQEQAISLEALQRDLKRLESQGAAPAAVVPAPAQAPIAIPDDAPPAPAREPPAPAREPSAPALDDPRLFDATPSAALQTLSPHPRGDAAKGRHPLAIRVVASDASAAAPLPDAAAATTAAAQSVVIPAGSILRGVLLSGMDAPTGKQARRDPYPALLRLKDNAILPNRFRADVRECFVTVAGYGDLSSERAFLRTELITCVRHDGGVIEVPVDGYAVGEDGKVGLRGRLVSKQGQIIAQAMQVSFLEGISEIFGKQPVSVISTTPGSQVQFQDVLSGDSAQAAAMSGTGKALDRLANYYLDMAQDVFPVVEIDAGRSIEVILNRGATLQLLDTGRTRARRR
jgi:conjugal transfer pilus assembly protein TraB